ncbi:MAG: TolC family protein [Thermodesulfovibrionales bacterium]
MSEVNTIVKKSPDNILPMIILILLTLLIPYVATGEDIKENEVITIEKAVSIALSNHPDIRVAEANIRVYESRLGQMRSDYYPSISLNTGITRYSSGKDDTNFTSSINLSQNIYDFGKRESKVRIEDLNLASSSEELSNTRGQVILSVKKAYLAGLQAKASLEVAKEVVKQNYEHLKKARGFYETGLKARYEVTKAEADLANSKTNLLRADNVYRLAITTLKNAMAVPYAPDFELQDVLPAEMINQSVDSLIQKALSNRQDYTSLKLKQKAQETKVTLQRSLNYPSITGNMQYGISGDKTPFDKHWTVSAMLSLPIFTGFSTKYQIQEALATLSSIKAQTEALMQKIILEVRQAYLNMLEANQRIESAKMTLKYAEENLELANGRYAAGIGSPIEVSDALTTYITAKNSLINAQYDYNIAIAELKRAIGE